MPKLLQFHEKSLKSIAKGIQTLAKAVKVTLGPKGKNVVINKKGGSIVSTKDGVTVAKEIVLTDKFENIGAQVVNGAASKTSDIAGDGTTTSTILTESIFLEGMKNVSAGANPMLIKKGIDKAVELVVTGLRKIAVQVRSPKEIEQIAAISANNDYPTGKIISDAMEKVGKDGIITVSEAQGIETTLEVVEGMQFDKGFLSPYFVTNPEQMVAELDNAVVLVTDKKLSSAQDVVQILEKIIENTSQPLLIIAEDIDNEALTTLVLNKIKAGLAVCAVKAPGFGDRKKALLEDIATVTGATYISEDMGITLDIFTIDMLGKAKKITVTKNETTIIDGAGSEKEIQERAHRLRNEIANCKSTYDQEKLEERLAHLVGGVAVINVGAATETELKEKKARVEDALHATRAAVQEGIVPGGGVALLRAAKALENLSLTGDEAIGVDIIKKAVFEPIRTIVNNCGKQGDVIAEKVYEASGAFGYDGLRNCFCDLIEAGIIDPVKVTIAALTNAASVASLLLLTDAVIVEKPQKKAPMPDMAGMGGMGGMGGMPGMGGMGGMF